MAIVKDVLDRIMILDGHNDTLLKLFNDNSCPDWENFYRNDRTHIDLKRALVSGYGGGLFAIFIPNPIGNGLHPPRGKDISNGYEIPASEPLDFNYALNFTITALSKLFQLIRLSKGKTKLIKNIDDLVTSFQTNIFAMILHFEGADAIGSDFNELYLFHESGLRSLGIVWSRPNRFGFGVPLKFPGSPDIGPGLTELGRELVGKCNELGIVIDLAHLNEKGFWDVAKQSTAPLVVTHSAAHAICPSSRNLTDDQLRAITESNGIVGINFQVINTRPDGQVNSDTSIDIIIDHIDHIVNIAGIDCVGIGTDFDGCKVPDAIKDVTGVPALIQLLSKRGYTDNDIRKIAHENWIRVLSQTWH